MRYVLQHPMVDEIFEIGEHEFEAHAEAGWSVVKAIPETQEDREFLYNSAVIPNMDDEEEWTDGWDETSILDETR